MASALAVRGYCVAMLRAVVCASSGAAKEYFSGGLSREDYYVGSGELPGLWGGQGARRLGLEGTVSREDFHHLCDNRRPDGTPLTLRTKAARRVGYDLNFHAPKSLSVVYSLTGDARLLDAFRLAVGETMRRMEQEAKTRVRTAGAEYDRLTGNLVWAEFVHTTARPIDGIPDPHLHAHCFTFNATWDGEQGAWKASQFGDLKRDASFFEAFFHSKLSQHVQSLGYGARPAGRFWELEGVPESVMQKFSRRTAEIEALAAKRGITDPKAKDALGAKTRDRKSSALPFEQVVADWQRRLSATERLRLEAASAFGIVKPPPLEPQRAVDHAVAKLLERASVVPERAVAEEAMRFSLGRASAEAIEEAVRNAPLLRREVDGRAWVTTSEVLAEERSMLDFARDGRGACRPFFATPPLPRSDKLSEQQRAAVSHLATSTDRVMIIRGRAGTGKTTLMQEAAAMIEASGHSVHVFAPSAEASRGVLRREGFTGAETVAKLLSDPEIQRRTHGQVIWVDEAGLMGAKSMRSLFELAHSCNARVVLSGDSRQHHSVERGDALRLLETRAGLGTAQLSEIRRQTGEYRTAVDALAEGRTREGFSRLDKLGAIRETNSADGHAALSAEYIQAIRSKKSALVVSPTHEEARQVTEAVRGQLKQARMLGKSRAFERLERLGLTEAERATATSYRGGMVVQFHRSAKGFVAGRQYEVLGRDPFGNVIARQGKLVEALPLGKADRFDVFERRKVDLAKGDMLRVTRNGRTKNEAFGPEKLLSESAQQKLFKSPVAKLTGMKRPDRRFRLENGSLHRVAGFTLNGDIKLENGYIVPKDFGHIAHGYCVTSHASQGKTVDRVLIAQSSASFGASSAEQFYVSVSRARESVTIFTDDKSHLLEAVSRSADRPAAVEMVRDERGSRDRPVSSKCPERMERTLER
jgi:conjugative relaxase-like TrwC/TraI family protein